MPTLQFKGKSVIWNHHLSVPYHTLEEDKKLSFQPEKGEGNLIIEGDNLLALKAILPQYSGKVKCIYIDPPYNTGNEGWVYNDNVNSPLIKDWIGKEVGRDDLTRHDKWLCMMVPRLKLLRDLLRDDGVIFASIDDNEQTFLKMMMDEIFGQDNFMGNLPRRTKSGGGSAASDFAIEHDYILAYARHKDQLEDMFIPHDPEYAKRYSEEDKISRFFWDTFERSYTQTKPYKIKAPDGTMLTGKWFRAEDRFLKDLQAGDMRFVKKKDGSWSVQFKQRIGKGRKIRSLIENEFKSSSADLEELGMAGAIAFPKPLSLLRELIISVTSEDLSPIILDSFAGSGTTMHAVMDLNNEDGGNRKCIMVQMTEATEHDPKKNICKDISQERIRRAIKKYGYKGGFRYFRVGEAIDAETMLSGKLPTFHQLANYVYYLCTGSHVPDEKNIDEESFFVGLTSNERIYLVYDNTYDKLAHLALNLDLVEKFLKESSGKKIIVYAPACFLDEEYMSEKRIEFVSIPYNLFTKNK